MAWNDFNGAVVPGSLRRDGELLRGQTQSANGARQQVRVIYRKDLVVSARCSCPMMNRCPHYLAVVEAAHATPEQVRTSDLPAPPRTPGPKLDAWLERHLSPRLLDSFLEHAVGELVVIELDAWQWWARSRLTLTLRQVLSAAFVDIKQGLLEQILAVLPALASDERGAAAYAERARAWRDAPPDDARLVPLWRLLRPTLDEVHGLRGAVQAEQDWVPVELIGLDEPDAVPRVADRWSMLGGLGGTPLLDDSGAPTVSSLSAQDAQRLAGWLIDVVFRSPEHLALRTRLAEAIARPAWARCLARVDRVLATIEPEEEQAPALLGWKVDHTAQEAVRVTPVELTPYKRREGYRTKRASLSPLVVDQLEHPADRAALGELGGPIKTVAAFRALRHLVGHPRVVDAEGNLLRVRERSLALRLSDEGAVLRCVPSLAGEPIAPSLWPQLLNLHEQGVVVLRDPVERTITVATPGKPALDLLATLASVEFRMPAEARGELQRRLESLERALPLELDPALRGAKVHRDDRPVLRLELLGSDGLFVDLRVRPLPGGPTLVPGTGQRELARRTAKGREYVLRDLEEEVERMERCARSLPLEGREGWSASISQPDAALELVAALQQREPELLVEWAAARPLVGRTAEVSDLRVQASSARDWFVVDGALTVDGGTIPLAELLAAVRSNRSFVKVSGDRWVKLSERLRKSLELPALLEAESGGELGALAALGALRPLQQEGAQLLLPDELAELERKVREADARQVDPPATLNASLRPYQLAGFRWLDQLAHWSRGACLADDMGLGKTVQALALLLHRAQLGAALVVAPASVLVNWEREAGRFAPSLRVELYAGAERGELLHGAGPGTLLVCSYEVLVRDADLLAAARFATVVFDEAQALKNPSTHRARAARGLDAGFHLALTGTPVENRVAEVWSLMRILTPGLLGASKTFFRRFVQPIELSGDDRARRSLSAMIAPFLLRRLKRDVAPELPARSERVEYLTLTPDEQAAYDRMRGAAVLAVEQGEAERMQVLAALTRLRQLACATRLVEQDAPVVSSKIQRLVELVRAVREAGEQALVFSQFVELLKLVRDALEADGARLRYLDGSTPRAARQAEIDAFQAGDGDAFLISLQAGGTGLNLTAATWVFHLDPWWNPAKEDQATDRAHRIGQDRPVSVVRLVSVGTIEERVIALHGRKRELAEALVGGADAARALGAEEILALLREEVAAPTGRAQVVEAAGEQEAPARHDLLVARFDALLQGDVASGRFDSVALAHDYVRAASGLFAWVEGAGAAVDTLADLRRWSRSYQVALDEGLQPTPRVDPAVCGPAFRRLEQLWGQLP
jgi:superfamily II DNA or RNA helicase